MLQKDALDNTYSYQSYQEYQSYPELIQLRNASGLYPPYEKNYICIDEATWGLRTDTSKVVKMVTYFDIEERARISREITVVGKDDNINTTSPTPIVPEVFRTAIFQKKSDNCCFGTILFEQANVGPTLREFLNFGGFTHVHKQHFAVLLLKNMSTLHTRGYTHMGTKPDNLFVYTHDGKQTICIGDHGQYSFGTPKIRTPSIFPYLPPEMQGEETTSVNTKLVDSWGVGKCILVCFCKNYEEESVISSSADVRTLCNNLDFPEEQISLWKPVLTGLLNIDSVARLSVSDAYEQVKLLDTKPTLLLLFFVVDDKRLLTPVEANANWTLKELRSNAPAELKVHDKRFLKNTKDGGFRFLKNPNKENEMYLPAEELFLEDETSFRVKNIDGPEVHMRTENPQWVFEAVKKGHIVPSWKKRWFKCDYPFTGKITYWDSEDGATTNMTTDKKGCITVKSIVNTTSDESTTVTVTATVIDQSGKEYPMKFNDSKTLHKLMRQYPDKKK